MPVVGRVLGWFGADVSQTIQQVEGWFVSGAQNLLKAQPRWAARSPSA